jgi:DNA-binding NtrC family response regulator
MQPQQHEPIALLIDDDHARRAGLAERLEALGVSCTGAPHVLPALTSLAESDAIHLVLIDEDVAEEAGFRTLVRATGAGGRGLRTILLLSDIGRKDKYRQSGVLCYAERPVDVRGAAALLDLAQAALHTSPDLALTG